MPTHVRHTNGKWYLRSDQPIPRYILATSLDSSEYFLISITLRFPNRKPIHTTALIDSGASQSCIFERLASRHSLPRRSEDTPIPILAIENRPIASGLVTHDIFANIDINEHSETSPLASVHFPVILGLDWLRVHNPAIDWTDPSISLSCCNLTPLRPVCIRPKGFGVVGAKPLATYRACSVTSVGLGLGLHPRLASPLPPAATNQPVPPPPKSSFLSFLSKSGNGSGRDPLANPLTPPPPKISICSLACFTKYARNQHVGILNFYPLGSPIYVAATSSSLADDISEPPPPPDIPGLPDKYKAWSDTVFSPQPPHAQEHPLCLVF